MTLGPLISRRELTAGAWGCVSSTGGADQSSFGSFGIGKGFAGSLGIGTGGLQALVLSWGGGLQLDPTSSSTSLRMGILHLSRGAGLFPWIRLGFLRNAAGTD